MDVFQVELAYGETLEAYRGRIQQDEEQLSVRFLRIGRVEPYYQTLDGASSAIWDKQKRNLSALDDIYNQVVLNGIRVARN